MNASARFWISLLLALHGAVALACGHCVEDKIAAVYDHAQVTQALARQHQIAFFAIDGTLTADSGTKHKLEALAESATGVDAGSARASPDAAALAVAFDPRRTPLAALQQALQRKFATQKLALQPLRVMDRPASLKQAQ